MTTTFLQVANKASSTLAKAVTAAATEVEVVSVSSFPASTPFDVSIDNEILHVTSVVGSVFTVTRAAQSTAAAEHALGVECLLNVTAKSISDLNTAVNNTETSTANIETGTTDLTAYAKLAGRKNTQLLLGGTEVGATLSLRAKTGSTATLTIGETSSTFTGAVSVTAGTLSGSLFEPSELFLQSGLTPGKLHLGRFAFGEPNTPAKIKATRKEYSALKGKVAWGRLEIEAGKGTQKILGIATTELVEGEAYWLTNIGAETIALVDVVKAGKEAEELKEEYRLLLSVAEIEIKANQTVMIAYDPVTKRWRVLSGPSG